MLFMVVGIKVLISASVYIFPILYCFSHHLQADGMSCFLVYLPVVCMILFICLILNNVSIKKLIDLCNYLINI